MIVQNSFVNRNRKGVILRKKRNGHFGKLKSDVIGKRKANQGGIPVVNEDKENLKPLQAVDQMTTMSTRTK